MFIAQVTGDITSTINHPDYMNRRLLVVDRLDPTGQPSGGYLVAVAATDAGVGDRVLVLDEGTGAARSSATRKRRSARSSSASSIRSI